MNHESRLEKKPDHILDRSLSVCANVSIIVFEETIQHQMLILGCCDRVRKKCHQRPRKPALRMFLFGVTLKSRTLV